MTDLCIVAVDIRSTHNIGSIFRTADGFSASVVLTGISPRPMGAEYDDRLPHVSKKTHDSLHKTALGAESTVKWRYFKVADEAINALKLEDYKIYAIEQDDSSVDITKLPNTEKIAFVVGPEVDGLSKEILDNCDGIFEIPMSGEKESFNVSIAAGIALYQARCVG